MKFNNRKLPRSKSDYVRGVSSPIPYLVRNPSGVWTLDLPTFKDQREDGFDTFCCWLYAAIVEVIETQCNFLKRTGQFPQASLDWFQANGCFDKNGLFAFSPQYIAALATYPDGSPVRDGGNDQIQAPKLINQFGLLPYADLNTPAGLSFNSQAEFDAYFFDPSKVTQAMKDKAIQIFKYISIAYEWIGEEGVMPPLKDIQAVLFQSPLQIGIPIPQANGGWNLSYVKWDGTTEVSHSVGLMEIVPADSSFLIADQYQPRLKTLSPDYPIPMVSHIYVTPVLEAPYEAPETAQSFPAPTGIGPRIWAALRSFFEMLPWG